MALFHVTLGDIIVLCIIILVAAMWVVHWLEQRAKFDRENDAANDRWDDPLP